MTLKQISLQLSRAVRSKCRLYPTLWAFCIISGTTTVYAQSKVVPQSGGQMSTLRLVSAGGLRGNTYKAGVDLTMSPGSHTYWKDPGESGVPPVFTFNGSENVATATVSFPVPSRISEEGIDAYGYSNGVVFPVTVTPTDRGKPSVLHVDVTYAVCNKICLPGHSEATLTLTPHGISEGGNDVAAALAKVPHPVAHAPELMIAPIAGTSGQDRHETYKPEKSWTLSWTGGKPPTDIFPDAPEGFTFDTKKVGPTSWILTAQQSVAAPKSPSVAVTLVLARATGSTSVSETFDVSSSAK